jgi:hypothetical protein
MNDRNDLINTLQDLLGPEGSRELAEQVFDVLRADDRIAYTDLHGLVLAEGVDVAAVAAEILAA